MAKKNPHAVALGRQGGRRKLELYGRGHYSKMGKRGGKKMAKVLTSKYGSDYFSRIRRGDRPSTDSR